MRIHRIALRNYRGVEHCEVALPAAGVSVVAGPNETGKSSLVEAVDLLLEYPHDSRHRRLLEVRPVDRDDGTEVEVELTTGPYHVIYRKRWFRQAETHLQVLAPRHERLTARSAHERMTEILDHTLDRDLYRALRLVQGSPLDPAGLGRAPSLLRALDAAAGGGTDPAAGSSLWDAVEAERARYCTPTGRPSQARQQLAATVAAAEAEAAAARAGLADLWDLGERARAVAQELTVHRGAADEAARDLAEAEATSRAVKAAEHNLLQHKAALADAQRAAAGARHAAGARAALVAGVDEHRVEVARAADELAVAEPAHRMARDESERAAEAHRRAEEERVAARAAVDLAEADRAFRRAEVDLASLSNRLRRLAAARAEEVAARRALDETVVGPEHRGAVDAAVRRAAEARAAQRAASPVVRVEALADVTVTVDGVPAVAAAGERHEQPVTGTTTVEVGTVARIRVDAGASAAELTAEVAEAERSLDALVRQLHLDPSDPAGSLSRGLDARFAAEQAIVQAARSRSDVLAGATEEELAAEAARAGELAEGYVAARPARPPLPPDLDTAEAVHASALDALRRAEAAEEVLRRQRTEADERLHVRRVDLERARERQRQHAERLAGAEAALAAARADRADDDLADDLVAADEAAAKAVAAVDAAGAHLDDLDPDTVGLRLDTARHRVERLAREHQDLQATDVELRTALREKGQADLQATADELAARVARLRAEHDDLERRAAAADLLHQTLARHRQAAQQAYVAPYRHHLQRLARLVFGPDTEVDVDPTDLSVTSRTRGGATVPYASLSTGAREQLAVLARLACAIVVGGDGPDGGAPVVLDDALGCTDPRRLRLVAPAFAAAGGAQIVVLTSQPDRFAALGDTTVVNLTAPAGASDPR